MSRHTVRNPFIPSLLKEAPEALWTATAEKLNWEKLEKALGKKISKQVRSLIIEVAAPVAERGIREKDALSLTKLQQKIRTFEKNARKLRKDIWYEEISLPHRVLKTTKAVENKFFRQTKPLVKKGASPVILLAKALDSIIAVCDVVSKELKNPNRGLPDGLWTKLAGHIFQELFEVAGLPHKVRKDSDNIWSHDQNSPFIKFYFELLKQLEIPWTSTPMALATALHRNNRDIKNKIKGAK